MPNSSRVDSSKTAQLGFAAFDALHAEYEPWLAECYVVPANFDLIAGAQSVAVFGGLGSGKTALARHLRERLTPLAHPPVRLAVDWMPEEIAVGLEPSEAAAAEWNGVLHATAQALIAHVARWPEGYGKASEWARSSLRWFVQKMLGDQLHERIAAYARESPSPGLELLRDLAEQRTENAFLDGASAKVLAAELVKAVNATGLSGICVLAEAEAFAQEDKPRQSFVDFLSTLSYFETAGFAFKFTFPLRFERRLASAGALKTLRVAVHYLHWQPDELLSIVKMRLSLATVGQVTELAQICEDKKLANWLMRVGGESPRGWLEPLRLLIGPYLSQIRSGNSEPITMTKWEEIRTSNPPRLILDTGRNEVVTHYRVVSLTKESMALLRYLHQNRGRLCTREELYKNAYLPLYSDAKLQDDKTMKSDYRDVIDTAIWRLRKAIEPDPKKPVFVISKRKEEGLELVNAW